MSIIEYTEYTPTQQRDMLIAEVCKAPKYSAEAQYALLALCPAQQWHVATIAVALIEGGVKPKLIIPELMFGRLTRREWPEVGEAIARRKEWRAIAKSSGDDSVSPGCFGVLEVELGGVTDLTRCAPLGQLHV